MKLKYLGVPVWMNGQNYYIPSLSYSDFKANYGFLSTAPTLATPAQTMEYFEKLIPILGLAIRRNYPEVADTQLSEWLDLTTLHLAAAAVQDASGLTPVAEGE
jgi:hypothetical protein